MQFLLNNKNLICFPFGLSENLLDWKTNIWTEEANNNYFTKSGM